MEHFSSNGKLLLTGEYVILFGSHSIALPTTYGQDLKLKKHTGTPNLRWIASSVDGVWFTATFELPNLRIVQASSHEKAVFLQKLLEQAVSFNPELEQKLHSAEISTYANFSVNWGLGTSSTLIANLAKLAQIDPYELSSKVTSGSGYDIACATANNPLLFQKNTGGRPVIKETSFEKPYIGCLYFVYSGNKMATQEHVKSFLNHNAPAQKEIDAISSISHEILSGDSFDDFLRLMHTHEELIAKLLGKIPIQKEKFKYFDGVIKSLGAWGGDFMLVATNNNFEYVKAYFEQFGLSTIIPFEKMILHTNTGRT